MSTSNESRPPSPARSPWRGVLTALFLLFLFCCLPVGGLWLVLGPILRPDAAGASALKERHFSGDRTDSNKIAIVRIEGVLYEGMIGYAHKQIERAAEDPQVKAVVLRINSPGGTITASDQLHHALTKLRDGNPEKKTTGKPILVSMSSIAASGGYYIAMPASKVLAERTTMTGSIGVYAALPNVKELTDWAGVKMIVIKRGGVKDSGSPFHTMSREERALWQSMIDSAYEQFLAVVEEGRPKLKGKMEEEVLRKQVTVRPENAGPAEQVELVRQRADGGTFTAAEALELGLIDRIGYLEDALQEARQAAGLGENSRVIQYDRPPSLLGLIGIDVRQSSTGLEPGMAANALVPRLWYLSGQCDLAGLVQTMGRSE